MSHAQGPIVCPIWGPIFCLGPIWVPSGDPFLRDEFRGIGRGPGTHLEAEGGLNEGLGAEPPIAEGTAAPPGSYFGLFWQSEVLIKETEWKVFSK